MSFTLNRADMVVGENTCDGKKKAYETFGDMVENLYVMDLPQVKSEQGRELLKAEYFRFKSAVEQLTGKTITVDLFKKKQFLPLMKSVKQYGGWRRCVKQILLPYPGWMRYWRTRFSFMITRNDLQHRYIKYVMNWKNELKPGRGVFPESTPRIVMSGCPMAVPNWKLPWLIESSGAVIVGEESCVGERGAAPFNGYDRRNYK